MKELKVIHWLALAPGLYLWWEITSLIESWWLDTLLSLIPFYIVGWMITAVVVGIYLTIANWILGFDWGGGPPLDPRDFP